jgi:hypothetical protein
MRPSHRDDKLFTVEVAYRIHCKLFASCEAPFVATDRVLAASSLRIK